MTKKWEKNFGIETSFAKTQYRSVFHPPDAWGMNAIGNSQARLLSQSLAWVHFSRQINFKKKNKKQNKNKRNRDE